MRSIVARRRLAMKQVATLLLLFWVCRELSSLVIDERPSSEASDKLQGDPVTVNGGPYNTLIAPAVANMTADGAYFLSTWNATVPLWNVHKPGECTHWCSPSAYHVWLYLLNSLLREHSLGNVV